MSFKTTYGYPAWYPWAGILLALIGVGSFAAVFYTMNVRWGLVTLVVVIIAGAAAKA